jgi:hypothetical protein
VDWPLLSRMRMECSPKKMVNGPNVIGHAGDFH